MTSSAYNESLKALAKAADAIENAEYNLKGGFIAATANRAYYACYYCIIPLLYARDVYAKTHQGARAKFSELFIKTSIFPIEISETSALAMSEVGIRILFPFFDWWWGFFLPFCKTFLLFETAAEHYSAAGIEDDG